MLSVSSLSAIPTLVELEEDQYQAFVNLIQGIAIDIDGENITLNADFKVLNQLQNETLLELIDLNSLLIALNDYRTTQLNDKFQMVENQLISVQDINAQGYQLINKTLGDLYTLEREEVNAITDEFFRKLDKVNEVLNTINGFVSSIETVIGVIQTFISTTQNQNLVSQLTEQQRTNTLLQEFIDGFSTKVLSIIEETPFSINTEEMIVEDSAYSWCEIVDPVVGEGPINCQTAALSLVNIPIASIVAG